MGADLAPGFRFCPTDEELVVYYLRPKACGKHFHQGTIAEVDIYSCEPWDLPGKSALTTKDPEWYFFGSQDKKYSHTARINRTTKKGYWKATGKDRKVYSGPCFVGLKKTLIYYEGRAPYGKRTNWIMHEYRLDQESENKQKGISVSVLCRIRKKGGLGPRNGEQYGAPVWNEGEETDEDVKPGKEGVTHKAGLHDVVKVEEGGNAFNLQNQIDGLRSPMRIGPVKSEFSHCDTEDISDRRIVGASSTLLSQRGAEAASARERTTACGTGSRGGFQSLSDIAWCDFPSIHDYGEGALDHQGMGFGELDPLDPLFDFDGVPLLDSLADVHSYDLHDYAIPAFDEPEILGEMFSLVNKRQCNLTGQGINNAVEDVSHAVGGGFIELKDMDAPLGEFVLRSPVHGDELAADSRVPAMGVMHHLAQLQGPAVQRIHQEMPLSIWSEGTIKNAVTLEHLMANKPPQVQKHIYGGSEDLSILTTREIRKNVGINFESSKNKLVGSYSGSSFNSCIPPHAVESSTRSYLSKHMATYAALKCEIAPAQLCYASFTDNEDGFAKVNKKSVSSTTLEIKDDKQTDEHKIATCLSDSVLSTSLLTNHSDSEGSGFEGLAAKAFEGCNLDSASDTEAAPDQVCNSKVEHVNIRSSRRRRLKTSLKGLVSKLKQTSMGAKLVELEEGMRMKFNERLSAHGKSAAQLLPTEDDTNPFDRLKMGILETLYNLAMAVLILSCLVWGYRLVMKYTTWVSV